MISSTANKQVRRVVNLVKKAKTRREEDLYVVEGIRMVSELVLEQTCVGKLSEKQSPGRTFIRLFVGGSQRSGDENHGGYTDPPGDSGFGETEAL